MAVKDGLPATDFSRQNREWVRNVAEGESVPDGLPATDFSRMNREWVKAVAEAAGGGGGGGGGGGDESPIQMAPVTLNIGQGKKAVEFSAFIPYPEENPNTSNQFQYYASFVIGNTVSTETAPDLDNTITVDLPMYNGIGYITGVISTYLADSSTIYSESVSLSGNAEIEPDPGGFGDNIKVTGDCTITITWGT